MPCPTVEGTTGSARRVAIRGALRDTGYRNGEFRGHDCRQRSGDFEATSQPEGEGFPERA